MEITVQIYELFKTFQPIIASLIAILGVAGTLYWNARLARSSEERKQNLQKKLITTFLISDLSISKKTLDYNAILLEEDDGDDVNVPANLTVIDHNILAEKIGNLELKEAQSVLMTYRFYSELPIRLKLISITFDKDYIKIENKYRKDVAQLFKNCASEIEETLKILNQSMD